MRVLVVEDNADAAELMAEMLTALGYETRIARDGPSALAAVEDFSPDVALVDIGLPVMSGYELAKEIRARSGDAVALIALTGYSEEEPSVRSGAAGFIAHLVKPVDVDVLVKAIEAQRRPPS